MSRNVLEELRRLGRRKYEKVKIVDMVSSPMDFNLQQIRVKGKEGVCLAFEMMEIIFSFLPYHDLLNTTSLVCKGWDLMSSTNLIWEGKYRKWFRSIHIAEKRTKFIDISWKYSFLLRLESFQRWRRNEPIISFYNLTKEEFDHPERVAARERMKTYRKRVRYFPGEWEYPGDDSDEEDISKRRKHLPIYFIAMSLNYIAIFDNEVILLDKKTLERIGKVNLFDSQTKRGKIKSLGPIHSLDFLEETDILVLSCQPIFEKKIKKIEEEEEEEVEITSFQQQGLGMIMILEKMAKKKNNVWKIRYKEEYNITNSVFAVNSKRAHPYVMIYKHPTFKFIDIFSPEDEVEKSSKVVSEITVPNRLMGGMNVTSEYMDYNGNDIMCFLGILDDAGDDQGAMALHFFHVILGVVVQTIVLKNLTHTPQCVRFRDLNQVYLPSATSQCRNMMFDYRSGKVVVDWDTNVSYSGGLGGKVVGDTFCYLGGTGLDVVVVDLYSGQIVGGAEHNGAGGGMTSIASDEMNLIMGTQFGAIIKRFYGPKEFYWSNMKGNVLIQESDEEESDENEGEN